METQNQIQKIYETQKESKSKSIVLWISRHKPLKEQILALEQKLGPIIIYQASYVPNAEVIIDIATRIGAKVLIPILPLSMIARLSELSSRYNLILLWAEMQHVKTLDHVPIPGVDYDPSVETIVSATDVQGTKYYKVMRFVRFHKIREVRLELEPW